MQLDEFYRKSQSSPSVLEGSKVSHISQVDLSSLQHRLILRCIRVYQQVSPKGGV